MLLSVSMAALSCSKGVFDGYGDLDKYNEEKQFAMILTNQGGQPVLVADPSLNVTAEVIAGLNAEYVKTKNEKNEE